VRHLERVDERRGLAALLRRLACAFGELLARPETLAVVGRDRDGGRIPQAELLVLVEDLPDERVPASGFGVRWTGYLAAPESGRYWLGAEGSLLCLDAAKGSLLWSRELKKDYSIPTPLWGFSAHPLVDGNRPKGTGARID
jgi:outer membrane protein assembly factor BamB